MRQYTLIGFLVTAILMLFWFSFERGKIVNNNENLQKQLSALQVNAISYANLNKRWGKKNQLRKLLKKLSSIKAFDKRFQKGNNLVIVYEKLDEALFNRLSFAIFSSDVLLVNVDIRKVDKLVYLKIEMKP